MAALTQLALAEGRPQSALAHAQALVEASEPAPSRRAAAFRQRAQVRLALGDEAAAREDLGRALAAAPEDLETLWKIIAGRTGEPGEALALVEAHRPAARSLEGAWLALRGLARWALKDAARAEADLQAAVKLDADGVCSGPTFQAHRDLLAPRYFDLCVERFPADAKLYSDRGVARYRQADLEGAVADFRKAAELRPDDPAAQRSLASALEALQKTP
mgnify:FL=1